MNICDWCKMDINIGQMSVQAKNPNDGQTKTLHVTCLKRWRQYWISAKKKRIKQKRGD